MHLPAQSNAEGHLPTSSGTTTQHKPKGSKWARCKDAVCEVHFYSTLRFESTHAATHCNKVWFIPVVYLMTRSSSAAYQPFVLFNASLPETFNFKYYLKVFKYISNTVLEVLHSRNYVYRVLPILLHLPPLAKRTQSTLQCSF